MFGSENPFDEGFGSMINRINDELMNIGDAMRVPGFDLDVSPDLFYPPDLDRDFDPEDYEDY